MSKATFATKYRVILSGEWVALAIFFSLLLGLIVIAHINQEKIDPEVSSKLFIEEENRA